MTAARRRWEVAQRHPCAQCGREILRQSTVCVSCWDAAKAEGKKARYREIERRWAAGERMADIAQALGSTPNAIGVSIARMRSEGGWNMPHRIRLHRQNAEDA
jgi:hypothetical protein